MIENYACLFDIQERLRSVCGDVQPLSKTSKLDIFSNETRQPVQHERLHLRPTTMAPDRGPEDFDDGASLTQKLQDVTLNNPASSNTSNILPEPTTGDTIPAHLSHDPDTNAKRTDPFRFGQRYLSESDNVFEFNAWDHVAPDEEHNAYTETQYALQRAAPVSDYDRERFNSQPEKWWDLFYKQKSATFFKDRKWLTQEFPILKEITQKEAGSKVVLEVGAGAGNTAFPIVRMNQNPDLRVVAADFSKKAVETMRNAGDYHVSQGCMRAEVWDVAGSDLPEGVEEGSVDVVIMIFIFSALNPKQWEQAVRNIWRVLKPGGEVLFRDYGRGDLAQVRFKTGRWMEDNFYVRGDGTRVYFFDKDELAQIWRGQRRGNAPDGNGHEDTTSDEGNVFDILDLDVDRRLIVNRQRRIKMYRCWMQGRFQKPRG